MSYSHLEKTILLGLKKLHIEILTNGGRKGGRKKGSPASGSMEELWDVMDKAYCDSDKVASVPNFKIVEERILDIVGCSKDDLRIAIEILLEEDLMDYLDSHHSLTSRGWRVCRKLEDEI